MIGILAGPLILFKTRNTLTGKYPAVSMSGFLILSPELFPVLTTGRNNIRMVVRLNFLRFFFFLRILESFKQINFS